MKRNTLTGTFAVLLGLALGATASPGADHSITAPSQNIPHVAIQVPAPSPPVDPAQQPDSSWDDTADTSDELNESLRINTDSDRDVYLETDLRNDVHSPLLENDQVAPADTVPEDSLEELDPMVDPLPR